MTSGLNAVTNFGCPAVETGEFLSPTPNLDVIDQLDPNFTTAYAQFAGGAPADDIGLQLWSLNKALALMLEATGPELGPSGVHEHARDRTRGSTTASTRPSSSPSTTTSAAPAPTVLDANCTTKVFDTAQQFVSVS